ncbi:hypothetical protein [Methylobacterium sp. 88A]|uniref:hypothetical protein n=1 Tax=Methylobacterium sp. 88A TaxID=1131813 RepID=UPI0012F6C00D|nr:hypothetical protein [Methylobacterium sp. 88A]
MVKPLAVKPRRARGPWSPSPAGPYTLPRDVLGRLVVALSSYRNRDAAMALAVFLARFWSSPKRLVLAFPIDRRALADHVELGLSEARVRGALKILQDVGFLDRDLVPAGSVHRATETGLHRKPVLWRFGSSFAKSFAKANARRRLERAPASPARRPPAPTQGAPRYLAQRQVTSERGVIMGEQLPVDPESPLERALARFGRASGMVERGGPS